MKINPVGGMRPISANYRLNKVDAYKKAGSLSSGDEVSISAEAMSFSKVFAEAKEAVGAPRDPDVVSRIAELKEQIAAGTYNVDSEKIADSILDDLYM